MKKIKYMTAEVQNEIAVSCTTSLSTNIFDYQYVWYLRMVH